MPGLNENPRLAWIVKKILEMEGNPLKGEKGDKGDPGQSIKGDPGIKGDKGDPGQSIKGDPGVKGDKGDPGQSIKGDKGDPGIKGDKGDPGQSIKGDKGDPGASIKGDKGDPGAKGDQGLKGDKGDPGSLGPAGTPKRIEEYTSTTNASGIATFTWPAFSVINTIVIHEGISGTQLVTGSEITRSLTGCTIQVLRTRGTLLLSTGPMEVVPAGISIKITVIGT